MSLDSLLGDLYRTIEDPTAWLPFLSALCSATGTDNAGLILHDLKTGENVTIGCHVEPSELELYKTTYAQLNPWMPSADHVAPDGVVLCSDDLLPLEQLRATRFYSEWGKRNHVVHSMAVNLGLQDGRFTYLSVNSGEHRGPIPSRSADLLAALAPHLIRVIRVHSTLAEAGSVTAALNQTAGAVFFVSAHGRLLDATAVARALLAEGTVLRLDSSGVLRPPESAAQERLTAAIERAGTSGNHRFQVVTLGSGHLAVVTRVESSASRLLTRAGQRMVVLLRPQSGSRSVELFAPLFGLTAAEVRLAQELMNSSTLTAAAQALGISRETAKSQMRNIFGKTGAKRQAEVIRVFGSLGVLTQADG